MMKESGSGGRRLQAVGEGVNLGDSGVVHNGGDGGQGQQHGACELGICFVMGVGAVFEMIFFWCWRGCSSQSKIAHH